MSKLTSALIANAMLSSIENYLFEIMDSIQNDAGELTPEDCHILNSCVRGAVERAASELGSKP